MSNIDVTDVGGRLDVRINNPELVRKYEKSCNLDAKKIARRVEDFLSRN